MGLDQYAFRLRARPDKPVDFEIGDHMVEDRDFYYWRKHPDLQGFMETLYYMKGGKAEVFNCSPLLLDEDDLNHLERRVKQKDMPHTEGFFFGQSQPEDDDDVLKFIAKARQALREGSWVAYDSWW